VAGKGKWYRVYIGRFDSQEEAKEEAKELRRLKTISYYSIRVIDEITQAMPRDRGDINYYLQTGTYSNKVHAEGETHRLKKHGFTSFFREKEIAGKKWFRVYIGTFKDEQEAQGRGSELLRKGVISYYKPRRFDSREKKIDKPPSDKRVEVKAYKEVTRRQGLEVREEERRKIPLVEKERIERGPRQGYMPSASLFPLSLKIGAFTSSSANDFKITEQGASGTKRWSFTGTAVQAAFAPSIRLYKGFNFYGGFEYVFADDIDAMFFSLGPKLTFEVSDFFFPYLKGGAVYGNLDWDGPPGKFDDGFGWETGGGVYFLKSQFKLGFDFLYRGIEFDYKTPRTGGVSASDSSIEFSGFSISGSLTYFF